MAEKRARIDAVLAVTGASALFTQDLDDQAAPAEENASDASSGGSTGTAAPDPTRSRKPDMRPCTDAQWGRLEKERTKAGLGANDATINLLLAEVGAGDWAQSALSQSQASALIERFIKGTLPTGESDIPADASEFERLRWFSTPLYGALAGPVPLIVRDLALALLAAAGVGAAGGLAVRRLLK
jgi:hypothetical protein